MAALASSARCICESFAFALTRQRTHGIHGNRCESLASGISPHRVGKLPRVRTTVPCLDRRNRPTLTWTLLARRAAGFPLVLSLLLLTGYGAHAQTSESRVQKGSLEAMASEPSFFTGIWTRSNLLGDMGGLRTALGSYGITLGLQETSEVFGNPTGGIRRGAAYDGLTQMSLVLDMAKGFDWDGGTFNVSALQIHGRNLSAEKLLDLQTISGIEANRATRLWELWYQQVFLAGRAAYPLSSLGLRLRGQPTAALTVLAGVFDDNPPGGRFDNDSQLRGAEAAGAKFN